MMRCMRASVQFLMLHHKQHEDIVDQVITGYEMWVHYYTPPSKQVGKQWLKKGEPRRMKAKTERFANKCIVTVF